MTCAYCGSRNADGERRCRRCGRTPGDILTAGALAAKPQPAFSPELQEAARPERAAPALRPVANMARAQQTSLFPERPAANVIPIRLDETAPRTRAASAAGQPSRRGTRVSEAQGNLEFLSAAQPKPRTLGTTVEAVIFCEAPVAMPLHRAVAAALDWSMVLIGYGLFLLVFHLAGGECTLDKAGLMVFGGALLAIALAYGLFWAIAGCETAGMRWTHLRLTTFDGFPPEKKQRLLRLAGSCLSFATVAGVLWALADEESLAWQDHMSRTFPTPRDSESQIFQRR
jgi:uncharacterized RDD family membrane protein YckC